jgi:class 3 adenylate cyclase/predicted ATPase
MDVAAWLRDLGLQRYESLFRDHKIDWDVLPKLTSEDLKEIGVLAIGHRRRLLHAIATLGSKTPDSAAPAAAPGASEQVGERRQLTVMFCDLVGSTALASRLDPEDLREVIGAYQKCVADVIDRFDGFVAKYLGDGILAYFGYPQAHEDDAERAVRASLAAVKEVRRVASPQALQVRIGLATGVAVVGDLIGSGAAQEQAVIGDTPNLAARLQALAAPDEILIPENTRRLVGSLFEYDGLGQVEIRGLATPVAAFRVVRESQPGSRFEALRTGETPLVGRAEELELLHRRWAQAKAGNGQVVLISADPGVGKSRLAEAFHQSLEGEPHTRLGYFSSPHHQDSALFPFIAQLERAAGFEREDTPAARLDKLKALLAANAPIEGDVQFLAELLSVPPDGRYPTLDLTPQRKKQKTFEALLRQLAGLGRGQPVLMIFEDLHWADPTSRELLDVTVEQIERLPVLLIATFRPEFQPPWTGQPHVTTFALRRLGREESYTLVRGLIGTAPAFSSDLLNEIVDRTDGVPLFLEELTKAVLETAASGPDSMVETVTSIPPASHAVPATLHASLMARLDRLGPVAKEIAQVGAAIGREFSYELLAATTQRTEAEVRDGIDALVNAALVLQRGTIPEATLSFKHALVRDAAYGTLLRGTRQRLHGRIAEVLQVVTPNVMDVHPELLAQHYEDAGLDQKAVEYWTRAGKLSAARSALVEAAAQFEKALARLRLRPDGRERQWEELDLQANLGASRFAIRGWAAPETGQCYARARALWEELGYPSEFVRVPWGQWMYHLNRGDLDLALRLADDLMGRCQERADIRGLILAHLCQGGTRLLRGDFGSSCAHFGKLDHLYVADVHRELVQQAGFDPHVMGLSFRGFAHFCLGYPAQALAYVNAAIAEAQTEQHRPSIVQSLAIKARLLCFLGDAKTLTECADQLSAIGIEQGFPYWRTTALIYRGWALAVVGDLENGADLIRQGISAWQATGAITWLPFFQGLQAQAEAAHGQTDRALTLLAEALQTVQRTGERWFAAELTRHKGQLLLRQGHSDAAKELYREALSIARTQEARLWELRAASSLAQLWRDQGRRAEARDLLAPVYGWFTEGFETADLKETKALLEELGSAG